jgi:hypothetical protein
VCSVGSGSPGGLDNVIQLSLRWGLIVEFFNYWF